MLGHKSAQRSRKLKIDPRIALLFAARSQDIPKAESAARLAKTKQNTYTYSGKSHIILPMSIFER